MNDSRSPFAEGRFEHERVHLFYLPGDIFPKLEQTKPTYLVGSRGTGKTTLLKALSWNERVENEHLQEALGEDIFSGRYIGAYLRVPQSLAEVYKAWLADIGGDLQAVVFSLSLDLAWLEEIFAAVSQLSSMRVLARRPEDEHHFAKQLLEDYPFLSSGLRNAHGQHTSLLDISEALKNTRQDLERNARLRMPPREMLKALPLGQVGSLGMSLGNKLANFCNEDLMEDSRWFFKICFDETESLGPAEQLVVNTMVRLCEFPVSFVVSFVSIPSDPFSTLIPGLTLQSADRQLIRLDQLNKARFRRLVEGVATVRIHFVEPALDQRKFSLNGSLGRLDLNEIMEEMLLESESDFAQDLLRRARELKCTPEFADNKTPPIIQAFLIDKLKLELPARSDKPRERRKLESQHLRKKHVAGYLVLCRLLGGAGGTAPRYSSGDMLLQLSDGCIRDCLAQLDSIFDEDPTFIAGGIVPIATQNRALKRASKVKVESFPKEISAVAEGGRLVYALAKLTQRIQTEPLMRALSSPERGVFRVDLATISERQHTTLKLIRELAEAGFLVITDKVTDRLEFRVHASLAPEFGFSYRGAYYEMALSLNEIEKLMKEPDGTELDKLVQELAAAGDYPLFE